MGSDGDRSKVTLQIQLAGDRSKKSLQTEIDLTVEQFKLLLVDLTDIPCDQQCLVCKGRVLKNPQTLRSYGLEPDQTIYMVRRAPPPPSTSISSPSTNSNPTSPSKRAKIDEKPISASDNKPQIQPLINDPDFREHLTESHPILRQLAEDPGVAKMLENQVTLRNVLFYVLNLEISRAHASSKADITKNIKAHTEGISLGTKENQLSLGLMGSNPIGTSGSGSENASSNRSELAPNTDLLSNLWAASSSRGTLSSLMERARGNDELADPALRHEAHKGAIDKLVQFILTFLRHDKEIAVQQGESIDRTITAIRGRFDDASHNQSSSRVGSLATALDAHYSAIEKFLRLLQSDADYDSSSSSSDSSDDIAPEVASEELFASQLAEMEEMGFMNRRENLKALLKSGGDVEKAVKRLLEKS